MTLCRLFVALFLLAPAHPAFGQTPVSPGGAGGSAPLSRYECALDLMTAAPAVPDLIPGAEPPSRRSVGMAALYSLHLPGMGELYAGGFSSGKYFLAAEGALWLTYAGFDVYGSALRKDARSFAAVHSGADISRKSDQFFVDLGNFSTVADYNDKKMRDRRADLVYTTQSYQWAWDSDQNRAAYRDQRLRGENVLNNRKFIVTAVLVNHIASAINAARAAISRNKETAGGVGELRLGASVMGGWASPHGVWVTLTRTM